MEFVAVRSGLAALQRRLRPNAVAILAYHNVVAPEHAGRGDRSLHLSLPRFIQQIERVSQTHEFVDLETATASSGRRPRAVVTFDDAYRGAVTLAFPELARRQIPAVVFVAPALLGLDVTWWDALAEAGRLDSHTRDTALQTHGGRTDRVIGALAAGLPDPALPAVYGIATMDEILAHRWDGLTLGSHAWAHEHLPTLPHREMDESLQRSLDWVQGQSIPTCRWVALPYGGGSAKVTDAAQHVGYAGVLRVSGGVWHCAGDDAALPRINIPAGLSTAGLDLRTSGMIR